MPDPNPIAVGGAQVLREAGIEVIKDLCVHEAAEANRAWLHKISTGRPYFIWKIASTIDGFTAAIDGTSQWITGVAARADGHLLRAQSDAILIGTGTAIVDDPSLLPHLINDDRRAVRYVMGKRALPAESQLLNDGHTTRLITSHSFAELLNSLNERGANQTCKHYAPTISSTRVITVLRSRPIISSEAKRQGSASESVEIPSSPMAREPAPIMEGL